MASTPLGRTNFSLSDLETFDPQSSTRSGCERRFLCPLCGDSKRKDEAHRSFCANTQTGAWNCKRCQATGKLTDFWTERPKSNRHDLARLKSKQFFALPEPQPMVADNPTATNWLDQLNDIRVLDGTPAETYLRGRGIDTEIAKSAGAVFAPKFYGQAAVVFPICDRDGQQTGVSGRYFDSNATPKTRIAGTKRNGFFTTPDAQTCKTIILTEAPIDALSLATVGFPAIALCGTSAPTWIHLLCGLKEVFLAFDADEAGDKAAASLESILKPFGAHCKRLRPGGSKDWNEALQRDSEALRRHVSSVVYPEREFIASEACSSVWAYADVNRRFRLGEITIEQRDELLKIALSHSLKFPKP